MRTGISVWGGSISRKSLFRQAPGGSIPSAEGGIANRCVSHSQQSLPLGVVEEAFEWVKATPLKGKPHKGNPPYPPLSGGYKKAMRPRRAEGVLLFLTPLTRGGRGGWFNSWEGRLLYPRKRGLFHRAFPSGCPTPHGGSEYLLCTVGIDHQARGCVQAYAAREPVRVRSEKPASRSA